MENPRRLLGRRTATSPNIVLSKSANLGGRSAATFDPEEGSNESDPRSPARRRSTFAPATAAQSAPVAADARLQKYLKLLAKSSKVGENEVASPIEDGEKSESLSVFSLSSDQSQVMKKEPKKRISYLKTSNNVLNDETTKKSEVVVSNVLNSKNIINNNNNLRISDALFKAQQFNDKYKKSGNQQVLKKDRSSSVSLDISEPTLTEKPEEKTAKAGFASVERVKNSWEKTKDSPKHLKNTREQVPESSESLKTVSRTIKTVSESVNKNSKSVRTNSEREKSNSESEKVSSEDVTVSSSHLKPFSMKSKADTEEMEDFSSSKASISGSAATLKSTSTKMSSVRSLMNIKDVLLDLPSASPESRAAPKTEEDSDSESESGLKSAEEESGSELRESASAMSYTEDFEESRSENETEEESESEQTLVSTRNTVVETKVKPKTKDRSVKSVRRSAVEKNRGVNRSCQTLSPEQMNLQNFYHTYSIPFACFMDPQLISSAVVGNRALQTVGVSRPGVLVLDDNLKQQLGRLRSGIEAQRRNYVSAINILKPNYEYTTWERTQKIMSRRCARGRGFGADGPG